MYNTRRFPKLSKITEGNIKQKPEIPEALKKLLLPKELQLEDVSLSGSEISDAFEDLHEQHYFSPVKCEKPLSKREADQLTMSQFTQNFKDTMVDTREELQLENNIMTESVEAIKKILSEHRETQDLPQSIREHIKEILKDGEYMCSTPSQTSDDMLGTRKGSSIDFDAMCRVRRMLAVRDAKDTFQVSLPSFNTFQQEEPHELDRPIVPWKTLDAAKHKCEKWLNEQYGN